MASIIISDTICDGNLGDGWEDNTATAYDLRRFMKSTWMAELKEFVDAGHTVKIDIDVECNSSGASSEMSVEIEDVGVTDDDIDSAFDLKRDVERSLSSPNELWVMFCSSAQ